MIRAVLFDLDDTLYCEGDFVRSGFTAVASELEARGVGTRAKLAGLLESIHFSEGRDLVLNKLADRLGFPSRWVPELVDVYRFHTPCIALEADAIQVLERLRLRFKLGCITDGWAGTQRRKIAALQLSTYLDAIMVSDDLGRQHWKPSSLPFRICCKQLGITPAECMYVGDDPERDVRGARNAGILSVRIRRRTGYFRDTASGDRPDFEVATLLELERLLDELTGTRAG